ncbi:MAG: beta-lactamase family protein [bacterium]|nr:beta-lactamase family protein [bacterium]
MKVYVFNGGPAAMPAPSSRSRLKKFGRLTLAAAVLALLVWPPFIVLGEHIAPGAPIAGRGAVVLPWEYLSAEYVKNRGVGSSAAEIQNLAEWLIGAYTGPRKMTAAASAAGGDTGPNAINDANSVNSAPVVPRPGDLRRFHKAEQSLAGYLNHTAGSHSLPNLAFGIYRDSTPVFLRAQGFSNQTRRPIASVTKTFTAVAILKLIERGKIRKLDDPIGDYLPELNLAKAPAGGTPVTIRHLLQQNSGIPYGSSRAGQTVVSPTRKFSYYIPPQYRAAGESFAYSNHNYYVLALLIETVSGQSYPEFVTEAILKRAGMHDSRVSATSAGASGVASSVADLSRFAAALYNRSNPIRLLRQRSVDEMMAVPDYIETNPNMMYYGLGVRVQYYDGEPAEVYHTGIWTGIFAELRYFPARRAALIHLGNPPNFRARRVNEYRAGSVRMTADYLRRLDELLNSVEIPALANVDS